MSLFHDFHVHALGQIRHFAGSVPGAYGLSEHVEYHVPGLAVFCLAQVGDDCGASFDCHLDFEGDLLASVNESLLYGERIAGLDLVWHVADFGGHGREVHVGEHDARAVRVPSDDFAV